MAVGRGGVCNLSHAEAQREPTPALPEGREDARREIISHRGTEGTEGAALGHKEGNGGNRERPMVADSLNSKRLLQLKRTHWLKKTLNPLKHLRASA